MDFALKDLGSLHNFFGIEVQSGWWSLLILDTVYFGCSQACWHGGL
jgi:hypothetical protein